MNKNRTYTLLIIRVTLLYFLWGIGLSEVQEKSNITRQLYTLLQGAYVDAYF